MNVSGVYHSLAHRLTPATSTPPFPQANAYGKARALLWTRLWKTPYLVLGGVAPPGRKSCLSDTAAIPLLSCHRERYIYFWVRERERERGGYRDCSKAYRGTPTAGSRPTRQPPAIGVPCVRYIINIFSWYKMHYSSRFGACQEGREKPGISPRLCKPLCAPQSADILIGHPMSALAFLVAPGGSPGLLRRRRRHPGQSDRPGT